METTISSIPELERFAREFLAELPAEKSGATVVGLSGDLGAGKTAFVKAAAKAFEITENVLSPTFVIAKYYELPGACSWSRLVHIDAYRIEDPAELKALRWDEIVGDKENLILIEWPERIGKFFPKNGTTLTFRFIDETTRAIS